MFIILFSLFFTVHAYTQHLEFVKYSAGEVLPFNSANSIAQDSSYLLWFSTGKEVYRYNGNRFQLIPFSASVNVNFIRSVIHLNGLLLFIDNNQLYYYQNDSVRLYPSNLNGKEVIDIQMQGNTCWALCTDGLYKGDGKFFFLFIKYEGGAIYNSLQKLLVIDSGLLLSSEHKGNLVAFDLNNRRMIKVQMSLLAVGLYQREPVVLLQTGLTQLKEIRILNGKLQWKEKQLYKAVLPQSKNIDIVTDYFGNIWLNIYPLGLICIKPDGSSIVYNEVNGLPGNYIARLFCDREKNIWISITNHLLKVPFQMSKRFTVTEGLYGNTITSILEDTSGACIWLSTGKGINSIAGENVRKHYSNADDGTGIIRDLKHYLGGIAAVRDNEVLLFSKSRNETGPLQLANKIVLPSVMNELLIKDKTFYAAAGNGIYFYDGNTIHNTGAPDDSYRVIEEYNDSLLIAGTFSKGIYLFKYTYLNNRLLFFKKDSVTDIRKGSVKMEGVRSLFIDREKHVWAGTRTNGIFCFAVEGERLKLLHHFGKSEIFNNPIVWQFVQTRDGLILAATSAGIYEIVVNKTVTQVKKSKQFPADVYTDGLVADQLNNFWLGVTPGILKVSAATQTSAAVYQTFITALNIAGNTVKTTSNTYNNIPYSKNALELNFGCNYYIREQGIRYHYNLDGPENNSRKSATTANAGVGLFGLAPGNYSFTVTAILPDGSSAKPQSLFFRIQPPFWRTWWFFLLCAAVVATGVYFLYRSKINSLRNEQNIRNKIARDLHDDVGSTLSGIKLYSSLALQKIKDSSNEAVPLLNRINEKSEEMVGAMGDIVWSVNPAHDTLQQLVMRMKEFAAGMLEPKSIEWLFSADENAFSKKITPEKRKDFFLLYKEAVNNQVKHAACTKVTIAIKQERHELVLIITDNGKGFKQEEVKKGNGLNNMKHRAANLKGKLFIHSEPGKGTVLECRIPLT